MKRLTLRQAASALWLLVALSALTACPSEYVREGGEAKGDLYFDLGDLLEEQRALLEEANPRVRKSVRDPETGQTETRTDTLDWETELKPFYAADLNKPAYGGLYEVMDSAGARYYTAKRSDLRVRRLVVQGSEARPRSVEASLRNDNGLYVTERRMRLEFDDGQLSKYELEGFREIASFDSAGFRIEAEVLGQGKAIGLKKRP